MLSEQVDLREELRRISHHLVSEAYSTGNDCDGLSEGRLSEDQERLQTCDPLTVRPDV